MTVWEKRLPGIGLCLAIALVAWFVVELLPVLEVMGSAVLAILIGMVGCAVIKNRAAVREGVKDGVAFTSKKVLQYAVILLGFGLNLRQIGQVGLTSLPIILCTISTALIVAFLMSKALHVPGKTATLIGVGSSICGGSAIAATAPVIEADDEEIAQSISVIFLFNVLAALIFPTLGGVIGLSDTGFGLFAGTAVNDTSSVTAAASTWDTLHNTGGAVLEYATIVKLPRTLAIIPITRVLALWRVRKARQADGESGVKVSAKSVFPMFILYFVLASVITTVVTGVLSGLTAEWAAQALEVVNEVFSFLKTLSKFFIVMAMAAIGLNTDVVKLVKTGGKPILMGATCWVCIALVSLGMQHLLGIW